MAGRLSDNIISAMVIKTRELLAARLQLHHGRKGGTNDETGGARFQQIQRSWRVRLPEPGRSEFGRMIGLRGDDVDKKISDEEKPVTRQVQDERAYAEWRTWTLAACLRERSHHQCHRNHRSPGEGAHGVDQRPLGLSIGSTIRSRLPTKTGVGRP
jgi:hypothetical protein